MFANLAGGALMWAVHFLAKAIPAAQYGDFGVCLSAVMLLPMIPLQMVLAQQTAQALAEGRRGQLSGIIRKFWLILFLLWAAIALLTLVWQRPILARWSLTDPAALWVTVPIVLMVLWQPVFSGVLQGGQNFLWLGWSMLLNALGRFGVALFAVLLLRAGAPGMMAGVLLGFALACGVSIWQTRELWLVPPEPFDWRGLLTQVIPLTLGFLGFQILFTADTLFVKAWFPAETAGFYVSAGTLSRALMWLVLPLAAVMFPKLVHSAARAEKSSLLGIVLGGTAVLAIGGAAALSVLSPFIVRLVFKEEFVPVATSIIPWYAGAMAPLALANVLLNHLLARPAAQFWPSAGVLLIALGYLAALTQFHASLVMVLQVLGISGLALLAWTGWLTWRSRRSPAPEDPDRGCQGRV